MVCGRIGVGVATCAHEFGAFHAVVCEDHFYPEAICYLCPGCAEGEDAHPVRLN